MGRPNNSSPPERERYFLHSSLNLAWKICNLSLASWGGIFSSLGPLLKPKQIQWHYQPYRFHKEAQQNPDHTYWTLFNIFKHSFYKFSQDTKRENAAHIKCTKVTYSIVPERKPNLFSNKKIHLRYHKHYKQLKKIYKCFIFVISCFFCKINFNNYFHLYFKKGKIAGI